MTSHNHVTRDIKEAGICPACDTTSRRMLELEMQRLRLILAEYESIITWDTTCGNCARLLDRSYEDFVKREQIELRVKDAIAAHPNPEVENSICVGCGYVWPCPTVRLLEGENDERHSDVRRLDG
jgi:hypothetical protein